MRIALVGTRDERARLSAELAHTTLSVAGEFATLADARRSNVEADALLVANSRRTSHEGLSHDDDDFEESLTPRELQVIELVAAGLDNGTIGQRLGISAKTVRNRVSVIFDKLGVNSRPQAIVWARDAGFGRKPSFE